MASDINPGKIPVVSLLQGSQAASLSNARATAAGKVLPSTGNSKAPAVLRTADARSVTEALNKFLNDSGRPAQFRIDPGSSDKLIQEINPANGAVVGQFSAAEFPALARSIGASGLIVDDTA